MKRKFLALIMAAVMVGGVLLTGCGDNSNNSNNNQTPSTAGDQTSGTQDQTPADDNAGGSGDTVSLRLYWWGNQLRNDVTKQAVDLYMSQNPGVEITIEFTDWSGYWDKMASMAAGGNLPDIIQQDYSYINQYQQSGQLADLTPFLEDGTIDTTNIPDSIIESGSIDGKCYALSLGSNAPIMTYDKAIVEEAGVTIPDQMTIDELYEIGQTIYEKTGIKTYFDGGLNMAQIVARARGSHLFDDLVAGDNASILEHYTNLEKFAKSGFSLGTDILTEKNPDVIETKPIITETSWNDFSYSNQYIALAEQCGDREIGITMYPTTSTATTQPMFLKPSQFFSIAETSPNKEEAAKFINWFTNSVECNEILMAERGIPISTVVAEAIKPNVDPLSQKIFDYIAAVGEVATPIDDPDPAEKAEIEAMGKITMDAVRDGEMTAQEAADHYISESKRIMGN